MAEVEGNVEGATTTEGATETVTGQVFHDYRDQLPVDLRANEAFTKYKNVGDLGKSHIEILGKAKELEGKMAEITKTYIPRLPDNPTKEQTEAYYQAIGRPAKPEEYELPLPEGTEKGGDMEKWAQSVFYKHGLSKVQASGVAEEWNGYVRAAHEAEEAELLKMKEENEKSFRAEFKTDQEYKAGYELAKRFCNKVTNTNFDDAYKDAEAWQVPMVMKFIFMAAKATGEDFAPQGAHTGMTESPAAMIYDKTPQHQRK